MDKMCEFLERLGGFGKRNYQLELDYIMRVDMDFRTCDNSGNNVKNLDHRCPRVGSICGSGQGRSGQGRSGQVRAGRVGPGRLKFFCRLWLDGSGRKF